MKPETHARLETKPAATSDALKSAVPGYLRVQAGGILLAVKLQPRASKNEIGAALGDELPIKVTAPPVNAAANQAQIELLADTLDCSRGQVELVRGQTSRHKNHPAPRIAGGCGGQGAGWGNTGLTPPGTFVAAGVLS